MTYSFFRVKMPLPQDVIQYLVFIVPIIFVLAAACIALLKKSVALTWLISSTSIWLGLGLTITACFSAIFMPVKIVGYSSMIFNPTVIRLDALSLIMLFLITIVALVIIIFSKKYLHHEPKETNYQFWFMLTLTSVSVVVTSNHFLIFLCAWVGISIGLHHLLMFYPNRPRAILAAHKKFLISRIADICMITGIVLLYRFHHTFWISEILQYYQQARHPLNYHGEVAAIMFAIAALLKCAQLPLHGWLMQVMEAPTPVSALLHAGIINMGGFLMILLSPLMVQSLIAQWLLLLVGGITAVVASLVMMTRISIKVMLAWSTCAQMGFMLVECGLGLYELALLHLIAHSFYKAYTFLSSGDAVQQYLQENLAKSRVNPTAMQWVIGCAVSFIAITSLFLITKSFVNNLNGFLTIAAIVSIAFGILLTENLFSHLNVGRVWLMGLTIALFYIAWHTIFSLIMPKNPLLPNLNGLMSIWVLAIFVTLFIGYIILRFQPQTKHGRRLYLNLFAGLYLDEWVTRITLKIWPVKLPVSD